MNTECLEEFIEGFEYRKGKAEYRVKECLKEYIVRYNNNKVCHSMSHEQSFSKFKGVNNVEEFCMMALNKVINSLP